MLQFRIVHCIQDVGKQVFDEEERGITKQLRILDQGNRIAFAIIGDYAFCRIRLELLIVLWIVLINDIANFCRVAVVVAIDFHLVFDDRFVCIVQQHLDFGRNVDSPFGLLGVDIRQEYIFRIAFLRPLVDYFEYLVLAHIFHMDCVAITYFPVSHRGTLIDFAFMPLCRCQRREHDQ